MAEKAFYPKLEDVLKLTERGKLELAARVHINCMEDLRTIYTPGVAEVCRIVEKDPDAAYKYTWIGDTVIIVTNGTAVLGLGDIGPLAGLPVMEGKAVILKEFGNVGCVPILMKEKDPDTIVDVVRRIAIGYGGVMLEDIAAPECFEIERRLDEALPIPVFHDDQHGTAVVVLAALIKALESVRKGPSDLDVVMSGAGAAGCAIARMLLDYGVNDVVLVDSKGAVYAGRECNTAAKEELGAFTNKERKAGSLKEVLKGADMFVGVSRPGLLTEEDIRSMEEEAIVFAMANPVPEIEPDVALEAGAAVATDGKTLNNALAFPGIMRGALDARAGSITMEMKKAAATTIAGKARKGELVPDMMDPALHKAVAEAVAEASSGGGS
ncbi:MAG: NADP-dependent malic enzyme [Planctomycetes bacterium]|nr:NADP-dependent malic enzyme [Planctomycetota bacterium]